MRKNDFDRFERDRSEDPDEILAERRWDMQRSQEWKHNVIESSLHNSFILEPGRLSASPFEDARSQKISRENSNEPSSNSRKSEKASMFLFPEETVNATSAQSQPVITPPEEFQNQQNTLSIPSNSMSTSVHSEAASSIVNSKRSIQNNNSKNLIAEAVATKKTKIKSPQQSTSSSTISSSAIRTPILRPSVTLNDVPESLPINIIETQTSNETRKVDKKDYEQFLRVGSNLNSAYAGLDRLSGDYNRENQEEDENSDVSEEEIEDVSKFNKFSKLLKSFFSFLFSHIGLLIMVIGYTLIGGYMFYMIEKETEAEIKSRMRDFQTVVLNNLSLIWRNYQLEFLKNISDQYGFNHRLVTHQNKNKTSTQNVNVAWYIAGAGRPEHIAVTNTSDTKLPEPRTFWEWSFIHGPFTNVNSTATTGCFSFPFDEIENSTLGEKLGNYTDLFNKSYVDDFPNRLIITAPSDKVVDIIYHYSDRISLDFTEVLNYYLRTVALTIGKDGWNGSYKEEEEIWTFSAGILFAITIITTIGYGHVTPKTKTGRFLTMIYAVFGIPMFFCYLATNGDYMAHLFRLLYAKVCRPAWRHIFKKKSKKVAADKATKAKGLRKLFCRSQSVPIDNVSINQDSGSNKSLSIPTRSIRKDKDEEGSVKSSRSFRARRGNSSSPQGSNKQSKLKFEKSYSQPAHNQNDDQLSLEKADSFEKIEAVTVPISLTFCIMAIYIIIGAIIFGQMESETDILKWSYFCFVTLSTIGFGDIIPGMDLNDKKAKQKFVFVTFFLTIGLILFAMCFKLMEEEALSKLKRIGKKIGLVKEKKKLKESKKRDRNPING